MASQANKKNGRDEDRQNPVALEEVVLEKGKKMGKKTREKRVAKPGPGYKPQRLCAPWPKRKVRNLVSFVAQRKRASRRAERKNMKGFLASVRDHYSGQAVERWEAGDGWVSTSQDMREDIDVDEFQDVREGVEVEEGDFIYLAGDDNVEDENVEDEDPWDWEVEDQSPCGGYMPRMDDEDKDEEGGESFGTSRGVAMVA